MADMDLDLDVPSQGPARPASSKFAPRGSKPLPKPKIKMEPVSKQIQSKMEFEAKPPLQMELEEKPPLHIKKDETAAILVSTTENDVFGMDVDTKEDMKDVLQEVEEYVDEVINEIDVYFSPSVDDNTKLYVWQYPMRPMWRPYELDERCKEVRLEPDSGLVVIDLAIDADSHQNFEYADDKIKITKQTLSSSWRPPAQTAYAIGVLAGNELHLNPVHAVVQLRPSLEHLKPGGSVKKSAGSSKCEGIIKVEEVEEGRLPFSSAKQWLPLEFYGPRSDISSSCLNKMLKKEDAAIPFLMSPHDYINTLCPTTSNNNGKDRGPSIRSLRSLPLDERFKVWFREGDAVSRFDTLKHLALEESDEEVLSVILKYARLVQGNWVAKSNLIYGQDTGLEVVIRDNVLAQFRKNVILSSSQLPQRPNLRKATTEVLNVFGRPSGKDWKFATPPDLTFLKLHPLVQKQQEESWRMLEEQINSMLKTAPKKAAGSKNSTVFNSV